MKKLDDTVNLVEAMSDRAKDYVHLRIPRNPLGQVLPERLKKALCEPNVDQLDVVDALLMVAGKVSHLMAFSDDHADDIKTIAGDQQALGAVVASIADGCMPEGCLPPRGTPEEGKVERNEAQGNIPEGDPRRNLVETMIRDPAMAKKLGVQSVWDAIEMIRRVAEARARVEAAEGLDPSAIFLAGFHTSQGSYRLIVVPEGN